MPGALTVAVSSADAIHRCGPARTHVSTVNTRSAHSQHTVGARPVHGQYMVGTRAARGQHVVGTWPARVDASSSCRACHRLPVLAVCWACHRLPVLAVCWACHRLPVLAVCWACHRLRCAYGRRHWLCERGHECSTGEWLPVAPRSV